MNQTEKRIKIIEKIKSSKWDIDFKEKVAEGFGYRLTGFTKTYALECIEKFAFADKIGYAYNVIVRGKK